MRKLLLLFSLLLFPCLALGQSTTVSGTVTEAGGQTWNNGTYTFQFIFPQNSPGTPPTWSGGALSQTITGTLSGTGTYSQSVPSSTSITPANSQWRLTVCSATVPQGCFSSTQTITGGTQTVNEAPPTLSIPPGPQNTVYTTTEVNGPVVGSQIYLIGTGLQTFNGTIWSGGSGSSVLPGQINPMASPYNAKFDVGTAPDGTTTSGSNIVTCPNADCGFLTSTVHPAKVGQIFFSTDSTAATGPAAGCLDNPAIQFGGLNQTTILSVDSDTQIHNVGNSGTTSTAKACIAWGDDDTTALNTAWTAGGCSASIFLPPLNTFFQAPIFQKIAGCPAVSNAGTGFLGQRIFGSGVSSTFLIPTPNFNFSTLNGNGSPTCTGTSCVAAVSNPNVSDEENFSIWGMGERCSATQANTTLFLVGVSTRAVNVDGVGWCGHGGGLTLSGISINGGTDIFTWGGTAFFGSIQMNFNASLIYFGNSAVTGEGSQGTGIGEAGVQSQAGSNVVSIDNSLNVVLQVGQSAGAAATWTDIATAINGNATIGSPDSACVFVGLNSVLNELANDFECITPGTNESAVTYFSTGGVIRAANSQFFANGTGSSVLGVAGNTFEDQHDNTFTGGANKWNGVGSFVGDGSLTTAVPTISSGFGTTPSIIKNSGAASFTVNVGTGGTATAGVIGLPTANAGWTCSVYNQTAHASNRADDTVQTANTVSTITVQNQTKSTGAAVAWTASDTLNVSCRAN